MKAFIIFVLLPVLCAAFFDDAVIRRAKRLAGTYADLRSIQCIGGCAQMLRPKISTFVNEAGALVFKKQIVDLVCRVYAPLDSCMSECDIDKSSLAQTFIAMLKPLDMICKSHYEEFVSYLPCYELQAYCDYHSIASANSLPEILKKVCDYASCHHLFQTQQILNNCPGERGSNAAKLASKLFDTFIVNTEKMLKMFKPETIIPQECAANNAVPASPYN